MKRLIVFIIGLICIGCSDFVMDTNNQKNVLVLSGWLSPEDGILLNLSSSIKIAKDSYAYPVFNDAEVKVFREDSLISILEPLNTAYDAIVNMPRNINFKYLPGNFADTTVHLYAGATYKITAKVNGYDSVTSLVYIPEKLTVINHISEVKYDTSSYVDALDHRRYFNRWYAYYNIKLNHSLNNGYFTINFTKGSVEDQVSSFNPSYISQGFYEYELITNGEPAGLFTYNKVNQYEKIVVAKPASVDQTYLNIVQYNKETYDHLIRFDQIYYREEDSIYREPANYSSNVNNGLGFIGAYTISQRFYRDDNFNDPRY